FLFDDVGLYGHAKVIGLAGQVGSGMIIHTIFFESTVSQIAPKYSSHTKFVGILKGFGHFHDLTFTFFRTEIDSRAYSSGAHVPSIFNVAKHDLVETIGIGNEFVVVDFDNKRNFMSIFSGYSSQNSVS